MDRRNVSALVTGGSGAIGRALIEKLTARGLHVVNVDRNPPATAQPGEFVQLDLTDTARTRKVFNEVMGDYSVGWLVNNAGIATPATLEDTTLEDLDAILSVNLRSALLASIDFTSAGVSSSFCARSSAAEPATCGVAIEVPWNIAQPRSPVASSKMEE